MGFPALLTFSPSCLSLWAQGIPVAIFFDDSVGSDPSFQVAKFSSSLVRSNLSRCGFEINHEKSDWDPTRRLSWIGYNVDTHTGLIFASDARIEKLCADLNNICPSLEFSACVHVKNTAAIVSQIISISANCGTLPRLR